VENKKIDVLFGLVVIAFLVVTIILIKEYKAQRSNDLGEYKAVLSSIVRQKNNKIKILSNQLMAQQKENEDLKNTLAETRNDLDSLSKKLAQPVPVAAVPAPAAAAK
jgi:septal ring factor EnvC (AmiA/AmiB activator)